MAPVRDRLIEYASLGSSPDDSADLVVRKQVLTIASTTVTILATAWTGLYLALGLPLVAAIPFAYQVISIVGLLWLRRTRRFERFRDVQLIVMLVLPFALQWSLGGFENSSAVSSWALVTAFGAVYFLDARRAVPWVFVYFGCVIVSGILEARIASSAPIIPEAIRTLFFVLNALGVAGTAYLLLQYFVRQREAAQAASEALLLNILPRAIAERLKREHGLIAEAHPAVTVLFADIVDFTPFAERASPEDVIELLDRVFTTFDDLAERHGLEKIKTIGDAYMVVGGLPSPRDDHAEAIAAMALDMMAEVDRWCAEGTPFAIRIGIEEGPVIAGVIGRRKFIYDLWGDTVNTASRMESYGEPGLIQVGPRAARRLGQTHRLQERETINVKGKGWITPSRLVGPREASTSDA